jgi:uncharacterized repeat protein (TIGR03803 family)
MNIAKALAGRVSCFLAVLMVFGAGVAWAQADEVDAASIKFTTLYSFSGSDGESPNALVQGANGELYGTTFYGGSEGTIFKITPKGTLTTLYSFCSQTCMDGESPSAGLVQATNGYLYGTTANGGTSGANCPAALAILGCGTIFKMTPTGTLTTVHIFCTQPGCPDGALPSALVQAANGDLYGTTFQGGVNVNANASYGGGTIFKITPSGTLTTLYSFCSQTGCADGREPSPGLVQATNGDLYGTTLAGGANCGPSGCGTVFKITPSGTFTTLYSFCSQPQGATCLDGNSPLAGLVQAANGDLYGTTNRGGVNNFLGGTVFKMTPSGTLTTLYSFCAQPGCPDGSGPSAELVQAVDGNLYGTTQDLGANEYGGTVFKITPDGELTTLHSFCNACADGETPTAALVQDTSGELYGTTSAGGANGCCYGTIFVLSTGASPFVETRPTIGVVGEVVTILGYGLKGATSVTFNGVAANFTVDGWTAMTTTVPAGATTGKVRVVTPSGTLTSNVAFEVAP